MIMPFVRLITIYIVVILVAVAVFNREQVMGLVGMSFPQDTPTSAATFDPFGANPDGDNTSLIASPAPLEVASTQITAREPVSTTAAAPAPTPETMPEPTTDVPAMLNRARQAYWQGDMAAAEKLYITLSKAAPQNADILGELGNIYYGQRRFSDAADTYLRAGQTLLTAGKTAQALSLVNALQSFAPEHAAKLNALATN